MCHCCNTGMEQSYRHRIRVSTQKLTLEKKFPCCFCWDLNSQTFNHKSGAFTNKLIVTQLHLLQLDLGGGGGVQSREGAIAFMLEVLPSFTVAALEERLVRDRLG